MPSFNASYKVMKTYLITYQTTTDHEQYEDMIRASSETAACMQVLARQPGLVIIDVMEVADDY